MVTNTSSPTSCTRSPSARVSAFQPSQSPSATPSSIEMIGYWRTQSVVQLDHLRRRPRRLAGLLEDVRAVVPQLARRDVEREEDVLARPCSPALPIASSTTSSASRFDFRFGAKPPSSPTPVEWPAFFRMRAQRVEDLGARAQRLGEGRHADRHDHELLQVDAAVGVRAAVQDVHHRHRQRRSCRPPAAARSARGARRAAGRRGRAPALRRGHRDAEQRVRAEAALGRRAVERDQRFVERALVERLCRRAPSAISPLTLATALRTPLPR